METPPRSHNHPRVDYRFVPISLIFPHNEAANKKMMHAPTHQSSVCYLRNHSLQSRLIIMSKPSK